MFKEVPLEFLRMIAVHELGAHQGKAARQGVLQAVHLHGTELPPV